jgi:O-antigen ligase
MTDTRSLAEHRLDDDRFSPHGARTAAMILLLPVVLLAGALGLPTIAVLFGVTLIQPMATYRALRTSVITPLVVIFFVWALISVTWVPGGFSLGASLENPSAAFALLLGLPIYGAAAFALASVKGGDRLLVQRAVIACFAFTLFLIGFEAVSGYAWTLGSMGVSENFGKMARNVSRGGLVLVCFYFPVLAMAWAYHKRMGQVFIVFGLVLTGLMVFFDMTAGVLGMALGTASFILAWALPRFGAALTSLAWALAFLAMPLIGPISARLISSGAVDAFPLSWQMRIHTWSFVSERVAERPWIGWGMDASRTFKEQYVLSIYTVDMVPLHPHNAPLQVWLETGFVGVALLVAALLALTFLFLRQALDLNSSTIRAATLSAALGVALVSFGVWQEWWVVTLMLTAGLVCLARKEPGNA